MEQKFGIKSSDWCHWEGEKGGNPFPFSKEKKEGAEVMEAVFLWKHSIGCEGFSFSIPGVIPEGKITENILKGGGFLFIFFPAFGTSCCLRLQSESRDGNAGIQQGKPKLIPVPFSHFQLGKSNPNSGISASPKGGNSTHPLLHTPKCNIPNKVFYFLAFFPHHPILPEFPSLPGIPNSRFSKRGKKKEEP